MRPVSGVLQWVGAGVLAAMMFLTASDVTLRQFRFPILGAEDLPVGVVTAFFGAPFFLYLLRQRKRAMF